MAVNSTSKLRDAFRKAESDGHVTDAEANGLIRLASQNTLTGQERKVMAGQLSAHRDEFVSAANTRMSRFVRAASAPSNSSDPRAMNKDASKVHKSAVRGQLFRNGATASDVEQGAAGDCYFVSTLASAARENPNLLRGAVTARADGSFVVRFYQRGADGKPTPVYVPVDDQLYKTSWGATEYAHSRTRGELWVSIFEKAYAKLKGSYEKIGEGGSPTDAMYALTGREATYAPSASMSPSELFDRMRSTLAARKLMCASTRTGSQYRNTGIVQSHAYTVLGVSDRNGVKTVTLRNPWGNTEPGSPHGGDGVFTLSLSRFIKLFPDAYFGG